MRFCWVCNNAVEDGKRVVNCDMCEGAVASVNVHPSEETLKKQEITKLRRLHTKAEKEAKESNVAAMERDILAEKLRELGVDV